MKKMFTLATAVLLGGSAFAQGGSFPLEANGGFINFNDDSNFKDTYYYGGATGFNFTDNAGIRGYYWKALQNEEIKKGDNLEIYGVETKVKAPISEYFKPYLVVGGGLLKPYGDYTGKNGDPITNDKFFGSAGAGLDLSFIDFLSVTGYARAMVSEFNQFDNITQEDNKISASWNYGGSVNFKIGDNKNGKLIARDVPMPSPKVERDVYIDDAKDRRIAELEDRIRSIEEKAIRDKELEELRNEFRKDFEDNKKKVDNTEVNRELEAQIEELEARVKELNRIQAVQEKEIEQTNAEFESIQRKNERARKKLEDDLRDAQQKRLALDKADDTPETRELKRLLDENIDLLEQKRLESNRVVVIDNNTPTREDVVALKKGSTSKEYSERVSSLPVDKNESYFSRLFYNHTDVLVGGLLANGNSANDGAFVVGVRPTINVAGSKLKYIPEVSVNIADKTGVNVFANAAHDFGIGTDAVSPYAGAGVGLTSFNGETDPAINLLLGTQVNSVLDGKLNVQYDTRNFFDYNQLSLGYALF